MGHYQKNLMTFSKPNVLACYQSGPDPGRRRKSADRVVGEVEALSELTELRHYPAGRGYCALTVLQVCFAHISRVKIMPMLKVLLWSLVHLVMLCQAASEAKNQRSAPLDITADQKLAGWKYQRPEQSPRAFSSFGRDLL